MITMLSRSHVPEGDVLVLIFPDYRLYDLVTFSAAP